MEASRPTLGRVVIYRSRTGNYDVPAIVTGTEDTLAEAGVRAYKESEGQAGVPPLTSPTHVHLTVLTPGLPGLRAGADDFKVESEFPRSENVAGTYQEWDIPHDPVGSAGTWRWPERV